MRTAAPIGTVKAIYRYPVKSLTGEQLSSALLGWHGIDGDRRYAFIRKGVNKGFPWLTAGKLPALVAYQVIRAAREDGAGEAFLVRSPDGREFDLRSQELLSHLTTAHGTPVELVNLSTGIFDDAPISVLSTTTIATLERESGLPLDVRRFRPNILIEPMPDAGIREEDWIGRALAFGTEADAPGVVVSGRDVRCSMVNLDPDTAAAEPTVLKTVARTNETCAGVYASIMRPGTIRAGDPVFLLAQ